MESNPFPFDFSNYNAKDPWHFPPQRMLNFAWETAVLFRESRNKYLKTRPYPDLRYVTFHELHSAAWSLLGMGVMLRELGLKKDFWNSVEEYDNTFNQQLINHQNMGHRGLLQFGFFFMVFRQIELSFRQILEKLDREAFKGKAMSFRKVYKELLNQTGLKEFEPMVSLAWAVRDVIANGGKFCPINRHDMKLIYKGKVYQFINNEEVEVQDWGFKDDWDLIYFLAKEINLMLNEVFDSPFVSTIPLIKARYLED